MKYYKVIITLLFIGISVKAQEKFLIPQAPPPPYFKMSKEMEKDFLKKVDAERKLKLEEIKKYNEEDYFHLLSELQFRSLRHPFLDYSDEDSKIDKEILDYEIDIRLILSKLSKASGDEKIKLKEELKTSVSKLFDLKEEVRRREIEHLEKRLAELNKKLTVRKKKKDEIVKRRVQELLGQSDYLEWE